MLKKIFAAIVACLMILLFQGVSQAKEYPNIIPMEKGTKWVYQGTVNWTLDNSNETASADITWIMEISELFYLPDCRAALVKGMICEVNSSEPEEQQRYSVVVQKRNKVYYIWRESEQDAHEFIKKLKAKEKNLLVNSDLLISAPLKQGKHWAEESEEARDDNFYCWFVDEVKKEDLTIKGVKNLKGKTSVFVVLYRTNSDHQIMDFVPGIGITRWQYEHHGTIATSDMRLVEYVRP